MQLLRFLMQCAPGMLAASVLANILSGASTAGLLFVVNDALTGSPSSRATAAAAFVTLVLLLLATRLVSAHLAFNLAQRATFELRSRLAALALGAPLPHLEKFRPSSLLSAFTEDVNVLTSALPGIPTVALNIAIMAGCFGYMLWLWPAAGLAAIGLLALTAGAYYRLTTLAAKYFAAAQKTFDAMFSYFRALTEGIKELKLHRVRRNAYMHEVFLPEAHAHRSLLFRGSALHYVAHIAIYVIILAALAVVLFALPTGQSKVIAVGYALVLLFIGPPIETILLWIPVLSRASIALHQIRHCSETLSSVQAEADTVARPIKTRWVSLRLIGVTFTYPHDHDDRHFTLGPVDIAFSPGETVFVVGGNGSGKSTLVKTLCGLYSPTSGAIAFDEVPVDDQTREWYRQHFSVVFSDFYLFDRLLGLEGEELATRARKYLERLQLERIVKIEAGTFSTTTALSQGQRKRLALLVAYLEDRPVYIFDEWAADQDPEFKRIFYQELVPELKAAGKTVLVVTHDIQYSGVADRVLNLENGRLAPLSAAFNPHAAMEGMM